jgi:hypothetical protein
MEVGIHKIRLHVFGHPAAALKCQCSFRVYRTSINPKLARRFNQVITPGIPQNLATLIQVQSQIASA